MTVRRFLAAIAVLALSAIVCVWALLSMLASFVTRGRRAWELAAAFDRLGNTAAGGDPVETVSARCWRRRDTRRYRIFVAVIDWIFLWATGEADHCRSAAQ